MTKDEALRLALDALNSHIVWFSRDTMIGKSMRDKSEKAIKACEEALAQPKREWVGLTDEEIFEAHKQVDSMQYLIFGKAIEAKLKEKNT